MTAYTEQSNNHVNGTHTAPAGAPAVPSFDALEQAGGQLPPLNAAGAWPVVRDRWDRLVTVGDVFAPPERVWQALAEPDQIAQWLGVTRASLADTARPVVLDFEDGEFFYCQAVEADAPHRLRYVWRWLGIGQPTSVTWEIAPTPTGSRVTVTEEAKNAPWDWQTWNGGGWPGILQQLASFVQTGHNARWPWRRMGPYAQVELTTSLFEAYDKLFCDSGLRFWLQMMDGTFGPGETLKVMMGDASGALDLTIHEIVTPGKEPPSFLPYVTYTLSRPVWQTAVHGRVWLEPAGWGKSLLQAFHANWENLPAALQLSERKLVTNFLRGAFSRAQMLCFKPDLNKAPHGWSS